MGTLPTARDHATTTCCERSQVTRAANRRSLHVTTDWACLPPPLRAGSAGAPDFLPGRAGARQTTHGALTTLNVANEVRPLRPDQRGAPRQATVKTYLGSRVNLGCDELRPSGRFAGRQRGLMTRKISPIKTLVGKGGYQVIGNESRVAVCAAFSRRTSAHRRATAFKQAGETTMRIDARRPHQRPVRKPAGSCTIRRSARGRCAIADRTAMGETNHQTAAERSCAGSAGESPLFVFD